jgi:CRISPR system Cascade subunit CasD
MKYMTLWLEAPLQAWGFDSKFDLRATLDFPTKSGVLGLLLAASGDSGPQPELLARLAEASLLAIAYLPTDTGNVPQLRDYHMVGNGYDEKNKWQSLLIPRKADGTKAVGGGAKRTYRFYLQNHFFAVVLGLPDDLAEKFAGALQAPTYDLFLGRKCCVPTDIIFRGLRDSQPQAIELANQIAEEKSLKAWRRLAEVPMETPGAFAISDVPIRFGTHKVYRDRTVCIQ